MKTEAVGLRADPNIELFGVDPDWVCEKILLVPKEKGPEVFGAVTSLVSVGFGSLVSSTSSPSSKVMTGSLVLTTGSGELTTGGLIV